MLIGVFHAGDIPLGEGIPNYLDLILIPVPLAGGTTEYHFVKAAEAECNDEWATTTKVSLSPEVAAP